MLSSASQEEVPDVALRRRHRPSGLNARFAGAGHDFCDYVAAAREMLLKAHAAKPPDLRARIVAGNAPFELTPAEGAPKGRGKPFRRGVLLVHGLTDSPYFMHPLAEFFRNQGFRVMAILLPGHGTQPGDLLEVRWEDWARAVAYGVEQLAREVDEVCLGGYSAGATLAVRQALVDHRVRGLFLFSPALRVSPAAALANLHKAYSWLWPAGKWVDIKPDDDIYKYESLAKNAAFQMHALIRDLNARLRGRELNIPVFAAASADDTTVDSAATLAFMARLRHAPSHLVYYTTDTERMPSGLPASRVELISSVLAEQNIVSFSHLSLLVPPEDAHYGASGAYSNCLHYFPGDMRRYAACRRNAPPVLQGEVTREHLRQGVMRRLTYNPHFNRLESSMQQFIERMP
jgi:esterase/lipase